MNNAERIQRMELMLQEAFKPEFLDIQDDSHKHAGHAGAREGKGHFTVTIVSEAFNGKSAIQKHRMVYQALGDMMTDDIHALAINAESSDAL